MKKWSQKEGKRLEGKKVNYTGLTETGQVQVQLESLLTIHFFQVACFRKWRLVKITERQEKKKAQTGLLGS